MSKEQKSHLPIGNVTSRPGIKFSFFNNIGVICGALVNVLSATGVVDFQSNDIRCLLNHAVIQMHLALLH